LIDIVCWVSQEFLFDGAEIALVRDRRA